MMSPRLGIAALAAAAFMLGALTLGVAWVSIGGGSAHAASAKNACVKGQAQLERNKETVVDFYTTAFNEGDPEAAVARDGGPEYIQHNPLADNGFDAFINFVNFFKSAYPTIHVAIKRVIAECDLVFTHSLATGAPFYGPNGSKVADVFRLNEDGKIVEHWDVLAQISSTSVNGNPEV
jgi:predicted SnoaL-like aldol condensation-catalyzing enzyme